MNVNCMNNKVFFCHKGFMALFGYCCILPIYFINVVISHVCENVRNRLFVKKVSMTPDIFPVRCIDVLCI